jgi:muramidase (phage lysozyme)
MSTQRQIVEQWMQQNPGLVRGLQSAIGGAEGAGYNTMFGGGTFKSYNQHPNQVVNSGGYSSAAAGKYQFLPGTWNRLQQDLKLPDFSPGSQDTAMVAKVRERLMPVGGLAALSNAGTLTPGLQAQLAPEWASFPTASGRSYYGQPVKSANQIQQWFDKAAKAPGQPALTTTQAVERGNNLGNSLLQQVLKQVIPAVMQQRSSTGLLMDSNLAMADAMPSDYLDLFA